MKFPEIDRMTIDPNLMGGQPCIRKMRVTVSMITGLFVSGVSFQEILELYPYLKEDIKDALLFATWWMEEHDLSLQVS